LAAAVATMGMGAADASATTFCVPTYSSVCPNSGGNVAEPDVEKAMGLQGKDGVADRVVIAAGTFTETGAFEPATGFKDPGSFEPAGSDPLTIEGAGPGATVLTSGEPGNIFLVNLFAVGNNRAIMTRDLTVRIPADFPDNQGAAVQLEGDTLDNVDIVSLNHLSDGVVGVGPGNVFRNGELRGEAGGTIREGLKSTVNLPSALLIEDSAIVGAVTGMTAIGVGSEVTARRVRIVGSPGSGVSAISGSMTIENSVIGVDGGVARGLFVNAAADSATLTADHVSVVGSGNADTGIEVRKPGGAGNATATVTNSILTGFEDGYSTETPIGPGIGQVNLAVRYSNLPAAGFNLNGILDLATGNIDSDPLLGTDLSLPPGSPSIDAGDPAVGGLATDFLGAVRPTDGNGDGVARRDQGAFEYQPPPTQAPSPIPDTIPPNSKITKGPGKKLGLGIAKFSFKSNEAGSTFRCKLDRRKAAKCKSPKTYKRLKPGRHTFKVWAIDVAGNKDPTPAKRSFRVPA
jgi:hypothetical protein